tara:strand:- start:1445 stop:2146 length:702 start_codon:yes stop_codon:yes gene_type:complete
MSEIRVENIIGENGTDAVKFTKGINVTGVCTATSFIGSVAASQLTGALPAISGANLTGISQKIVQVKQLYYSNTPNAFSSQAGTQLHGSTYFPVGARIGGSFTKTSSTSKILLFGKLSYIMGSTNVHGACVWVVGDESNYVNLLDDSRNYGQYGSNPNYAHMNTPCPGVYFDTAYNAGTVTCYMAPAVEGTRSHTGCLNGNPHTGSGISGAGNADTPNKNGHSMLTVVEIEFS